MNNSRCIFVPIGSYEQHGPHLPPETDYLIAKSTTNRLTSDFKTCSRFQILVLEGVKIGISPEHLGFKYTRTITPRAFEVKISSLLDNYKNDTKFVFVNAHGGNNKHLKHILHLKNEDILLLNTFSIIKEELLSIRTSKLGGICHAGEFETSLMLYLYPNRVHMNKLTPNDVFYIPALDPNCSEKKRNAWKTSDFSKSGILGDPYHASVEKGKIWFDHLLEKAKQLIKHFLDE